MSELRLILSDTFADARERLAEAVFDERRSLYSVALARILLGLCVLGLLATNFGSRGVWAGPGSVWVEQARSLSAFPEVRFLSGVSGDVFTIVYVLVMLAAVAFMIGWRTKLANIVLAFGFIAIIGQNPITAAQADNVLRMGLLWFLLIDASAVWSVDARRRERRARRRAENVMPGWFVTSMHNIGLFGLLVQVSLVYVSAGLDKVVSPLWQNGSALGYTLRLPDYRAIGWLADLFVSTSFLTAVLTYLVLVVQLYFVPLLLNRHTRLLIVVLAIAVNALFALLFGQPWESLAVIAVTVLFLPSEQVPLWLETIRFSRGGDWVANVVFAVIDRIVSGVDAVKFRVWDPIADRLRGVARR